jgi:mannose/fructose/N-acetylgalactosamine-specific phosphotransferase system component IIB
VPVSLFRIDDRLVHGQVVVGWGQPLDIGFVVLVDDSVATSEWEQELYRMGVPPGMQLYFETVEDARERLFEHERDSRQGIVLTGDISSMARLLEGMGAEREVNLGGLHQSAGRTQRLRYIFLGPQEEQELRQLAARGHRIIARDVPSARAVELEDLLSGKADG